MPVTYDEYEKHLADQSIFNITVMANVEETESQVINYNIFKKTIRYQEIIY